MEILLGIACGLLLYLFYKNIKTKKENTFLKLALLEEFAAKNMPTPDEDPDSFLKFVSDSRELAFEYIENVQKDIKDFVLDLKNDVKHFERFGVLTEQYPNYEIAKKCVTHYRKLEALLPEESKND
jgi:hypothetical protein